MNLYLNGCGKYPAEQALLTFFPGERPEYPEGEPQGERCEINVAMRNERIMCTCLLVRGGQAYRSRASMDHSRIVDEVTRERYTGRVVKLAFFRAAVASGIPYPEWGCLTGVRPVKLVEGYLREGMTPAGARGRFMREYYVSKRRATLSVAAAQASIEADRSLGERDVCLYVGIPFCPTRCAYCSFVSQSVEKSLGLVEPYLEALEREISATAEAASRAQLRPVALYIGGGTPTTLSAGQLDRLCAQLERSFDLSALREYTVEAGRPDTITADNLAALRAHGVKRLSVNPQTMSDPVLSAIGRRHTAKDIENAMSLVRSAGRFEVNMDLIAGLQTDTAEGFADSLERVLALRPDNITIHTLAVKRGSRLHAEGAEQLPAPEEVERMLSGAMNRLTAARYEPYYLYRQKYMSGGFENVGWTKPWRASLYNICIMEELRSIIAMGAGGSTKLIAPGGRLERHFAPKYPGEYIAAIDRVCADKERIVDFHAV